MKTTYTIALSLALVAGLCSCQKEEKEMPQPSGVPMTLHASFAAETKATATPLETGGLKTTWNAGDKISVLTLDASGDLMYNDVFTSDASDGATDAVFSGTYTGGGVEGGRIVCYYPALEYSYSGPYSVSEDNLLLNTVWEGYKTGCYRIRATQDGNNSTNGVSENLILSGEAVINGSELSTTLNNRIAVLKIIVRNADDVFRSANMVSITSTQNVLEMHENNARFTTGTVSGFMNNNTANAINSFTMYVNNITNGSIGAEEALVFYMPVVLNPATAGEVWTIGINGQDLLWTTKTRSATKTFSKAFTFEAGVCYPISFDASEFE